MITERQEFYFEVTDLKKRKIDDFGRNWIFLGHVQKYLTSEKLKIVEFLLKITFFETIQSVSIKNIRPYVTIDGT